MIRGWRHRHWDSKYSFNAIFLCLDLIILYDLVAYDVKTLGSTNPVESARATNLLLGLRNFHCVPLERKRCPCPLTRRVFVVVLHDDARVGAWPQLPLRAVFPEVFICGKGAVVVLMALKCFLIL